MSSNCGHCEFADRSIETELLDGNSRKIRREERGDCYLVVDEVIEGGMHVREGDIALGVEGLPERNANDGSGV